MHLKKSIIVEFDKKWCRDIQVPASLLFELSGNKKTSITLASFRFFVALFLLAELLGYFFITLGFSASSSIWIFLAGIILKIGGTIVSAFFQNKSGIFLSLELQKYLKRLNTHSLEIRSFLAERGCSESEINALQSLPTEVYQSELNSHQGSRILNIGAPFFCGLALLANGDIITSFVVIILGLASFPIGEKFFKESTRRESELRLGLAAQIPQYVNKIYSEHVWLTTKVNFLSQLPLLLFAFRFIWNGTGQLLASFFGLTQGLAGLTGTLAFQKARVAAMRTTKTVSHLIHALASPYLIVTPQRWKEHCSGNEKIGIPTLAENHNGLFLKDFSPNVPFQEKEIFSISCFIPFGSICLLKAPSGKGKSTFLSALTHLIEHRGDLLFVNNGQVLNAHELSRDKFDSKIFFFKEENVDKSVRVIDLCKNITFIEIEPFLQKSRIHFDSLLVDLAWKSPDNLVEQEIKNLESHRQAVFPNQMLDFLKDLRKRQSVQIQLFLEKSKGNLVTEHIFPERNFLTLSSGEKRRLTTLMALESCRTLKEIRFVILDEPLTHLDKTNIDYQLQAIHEMQKLTFPPAILIISHHFIEEMNEKLCSVQEIEV